MPFVAEHLGLALTRAREALWLSSPNPRVGCVIATPDGKVLGTGHTQQTGGPHAEIMALQAAAAQGHSVEGACAYVTLEPCAHHGRTGPCCDALVRAGIRKVVAALQDPNPLVAGQGFAKLSAAGVEVEVLPRDHPLALQSRALNIGFFSRMLRATPWVRMKVAASLDGTTALHNGASQWITSPEARADGHAWRARACAVLTGIGTLLSDRPQLDVRLVPTHRQPHAVVIDSRLETPLDAPIFIAPRAVYIYAAARNDAKQAALEARGAVVVQLPAWDAQGHPTGQVDLPAMLRDLAQREINELHVEAGARLNGALLRSGCVDEVLLYLAPMLLGQGAGLCALGPLNALSEAVALDMEGCERIGPDVRLIAQIRGRAQF